MRNRGPKVAVVIVTYNSQRFIRECVNSVLKQNYPNKEIWVVDNGSEDNTIEILSRYPDIHLITNEKNLGVCEARNQVIVRSDAEYFLTVDSDVVLDVNFIKSLMEIAETFPERWGMFWGKVIDMRKRDRIDTLGIYLTRFFRFYDWGQGKRITDTLIVPETCLAPCACAALYKRELMEDVSQNGHYFDSRFHYLVEDFDIAMRAKQRGWKGKYVEKAIAYHYRHGSGFQRGYIRYLSFRNRYLLIKKHCKIKDVPFLIISFFIYDVPRFIYLMAIDPKSVFRAITEVSRGE
ncbi:MAG: glycosyltransferase family 2 protein [Candidatus Omnitrophica bacterium]|nr:glycosyltransferase family 2 protein [Candidatus Omnitrophota bacterium]